MNVLIVNGNEQYKDMFERRGFNVVRHIQKADLVQFCGGADVSPELYGEKPHPNTGCDPSRDAFEQFIYRCALEDSIPMAGICRGGQFLNVMNGGIMYQHVDGHTLRSHKLWDMRRQYFVDVTSTHHQMMIPSPDATVIGVAGESTIREWVDDENFVQADHRQHDEWDYEVLFYPRTSCLCFQPHPEFPDSGCEDYYFDLLREELQCFGG